MQILLSLLAGLLFGTGLIISGMANPAKVQNFLDITGNWDPSLALVMCGAILVTLPGFYLLRKKHKPFLAEKFSWPTATHFDTKLLGGASLFGIGWGLSGFCPGPAVTALPLAANGTLIFVPAMLAGLVIAKLVLPK
ncbi:hypothetical protein AB833_17985 [Chromatiales bacterium (ex Bugula neritina AB1)]|nr:hypothetical protein AB833_17985 [Chromatiales bacterium (ex Bugula neritina AB1)]